MPRHRASRRRRRGDRHLCRSSEGLARLRAEALGDLLWLTNALQRSSRAMRSDAIDLATIDDADMRRHIEGAAAGDATTRHALVVALGPIVQSRVARALLRRVSSSRSRNPRQDVEDMVQEVFAALLARDCRVLLAWDPGRGLRFDRFVSFIAEREVAMILRTGKRSAWAEDPTTDDTMARLVGVTESHESAVASREELRQLCDRLRERLSPKARQYFQLLFVEEHAVDAVSAMTGLSADALYAWRSRLGKLARELQADLAAENYGVT